MSFSTNNRDLSPPGEAVAKALKLIILANRLLKNPNFFQRPKAVAAPQFPKTKHVNSWD